MGIIRYLWVFMGIYSRLKPMSETNQSVKIILGGPQTHNSRIFLGSFRNMVRTSSEIKKSRIFKGCFTVFSRAFPGFLEAQNENNVHNELF